MTPIPTIDTLVTTLDEHEDALTAIAKASRDGDEGASIAAITGLLTQLVTGLPLVGPLASEAAKAVFARSAYGEVQAALAELEKEQGAEAERRATAQAVAHVLAPALGLIVDATRGLRDDLEKLETQLAAARSAKVRARVETVEGRSTVVRVGGRLETDVDLHIGTLKDEALVFDFRK